MKDFVKRLISGEKLWAFLFSLKFVIYACILLAVVTRQGK